MISNTWSLGSFLRSTTLQGAISRFRHMIITHRTTPKRRGLKEGLGKEGNFCMEPSTSICMEFGEGQHLLIEDYILRNIDPTSQHAKTLVALMLSTIIKKHTLLGSKGKFVRSI
jgi:hypothetical protein